MINQHQGIVLKREFNAPRELVFKVWTDPAHFGNWWGPQGVLACSESHIVEKFDIILNKLTGSLTRTARFLKSWKRPRWPGSICLLS
jgi:hypothetical protein